MNDEKAQALEESKDSTGENKTEEQAANTETSDVKADEMPQPVPVDDDYTPVPVTLKSLLDAGAHFGHQCQRWNPKMIPFIFGERNGVHIINLDETLKHWKRAEKFITDISSQGGSVLFIGTKNQAQDVVKEHAERCGAFYVTSRWLGGTLSNFETIKRSIDRMNRYEQLLEKANDPDNEEIKLNKKEKLGITRELEKLENNLGGIRAMKKLPELVFIIDINKESIAVAESRKLHIPVIALVDTNTDPNRINFPIPANDDAIRTIRLFVAAVADAVLKGRSEYQARLAKINDAVDSQKEKSSGEHKRSRKTVIPGNGNGKDTSTETDKAKKSEVAATPVSSATSS